MQMLCDLYGVQRSSLAQIIAHNPQVQTVLAAEILPDSPNEDIVLSSCLARQGIPAIERIVDEPYPRSVPH